MSDVAIKVCILGELVFFMASPARSISLSSALAREQTVESLTAFATALTASKSPVEAIANPASITSTRIFSSIFAIRIFSSLVIEAPGDCSPSLNVVSNIINLSDIGYSFFVVLILA